MRGQRRRLSPRALSLSSAEQGPEEEHGHSRRHEEEADDPSPPVHGRRRHERGDRDGQGGWIHYSLLSGNRTVIVDRDLTPLFVKPDASAPVNAYAEAGVVAQLGECLAEWCRISAGGERGWVEKAALWGVGTDEIPE